MFDDWHEYYFMIGSCAAALIGLMFVVITLTAGRGRSESEEGKHLYTSPIVWHLSAILALSGAAMSPTVPAQAFAILAGGAAILGAGFGIRSAVGIARWEHAPSRGFEIFWYGIAPTLAYAGLAVAAAGTCFGTSWASTAVAGSMMALLLLSIHAEWDLVTFLAPDAGQPHGGPNEDR